MTFSLSSYHDILIEQQQRETLGGETAGG